MHFENCDNSSAVVAEDRKAASRAFFTTESEKWRRGIGAINREMEIEREREGERERLHSLDERFALSLSRSRRQSTTLAAARIEHSRFELCSRKGKFRIGRGNKQLSGDFNV